jgi:hypothetical protein
LVGIHSCTAGLHGQQPLFHILNNVDSGATPC